MVGRGGGGMLPPDLRGSVIGLVWLRSCEGGMRKRYGEVNTYGESVLGHGSWRRK